MALYVYAIIAADHPAQVDGLRGVGDPPGGLETVDTSSLKAVVSEAPGELRARRRDLLAHQHVLERLMQDGAVLPMRFGLAAPGRQALQASLEEDAEGYTEGLRRVTGCVEYHLKGSRDEDEVMREIIEGSEEIQRLRTHTLENPDAHDDKIALGELLSQEISARAADDVQSVVGTLAPGAARYEEGEPDGEHFLSVSFLIERGRAREFGQAVDDEATRRGDSYSFTLHGPLPPYSFV